MKFRNWTTVALAVLALTLPLTAQDTSAPGTIHRWQPKVRDWRKPPQLPPEQIQVLRMQAMKKKQPTLPLWDYHLIAPRDGNPYTGVAVGNDPSKPNSGEGGHPDPDRAAHHYHAQDRHWDQSGWNVHYRAGRHGLRSDRRLFRLPYAAQ